MLARMPGVKSRKKSYKVPFVLTVTAAAAATALACGGSVAGDSGGGSGGDGSGGTASGGTGGASGSAAGGTAGRPSVGGAAGAGGSSGTAGSSAVGGSTGSVGGSAGIGAAGGAAGFGGSGVGGAGGSGCDPNTDCCDPDVDCNPPPPPCPDTLPAWWDSCGPELAGAQCSYGIDCQSGTQVFVMECAAGAWKLQPSRCVREADSCPGTELHCQGEEWWMPQGTNPPSPCPPALPGAGEMCFAGGFGGTHEACGYRCDGGWQVARCVSGAWDLGACALD